VVTLQQVASLNIAISSHKAAGYMTSSKRHTWV